MKKGKKWFVFTLVMLVPTCLILFISYVCSITVSDTDKENMITLSEQILDVKSNDGGCEKIINVDGWICRAFIYDKTVMLDQMSLANEQMVESGSKELKAEVFYKTFKCSKFAFMKKALAGFWSKECTLKVYCPNTSTTYIYEVWEANPTEKFLWLQEKIDDSLSLEEINVGGNYDYVFFYSDLVGRK